MRWQAVEAACGFDPFRKRDKNAPRYTDSGAKRHTRKKRIDPLIFS